MDKYLKVPGTPASKGKQGTLPGKQPMIMPSIPVEKKRPMPMPKVPGVKISPNKQECPNTSDESTVGG